MALPLPPFTQPTRILRANHLYLRPLTSGVVGLTATDIKIGLPLGSHPKAATFPIGMLSSTYISRNLDNHKLKNKQINPYARPISTTPIQVSWYSHFPSLSRICLGLSFQFRVLKSSTYRWLSRVPPIYT